MRISDWSSDVCSSDLVLYVLTESWVVLHGYRGKGFKYPAVDMQPFPWRQKAGRGLFHAKHPSCYGGRRDRRGLPIHDWPADGSCNGQIGSASGWGDGCRNVSM